MLEKLNKIRETLVEKLHNEELTQSLINGAFDELCEEFKYKYNIIPSNSTWYSNCECCGYSFKIIGETTNGICDKCNTEIRRIERVKCVKKYMKERGI